MKTFKIGNIPVGGDRTFIIAEAGVNHNGQPGLALEMIRAAKACGADAVKFQSFRAEHMCVKTLCETKSVEGITGGTKSSFDMYRALELSLAAHEILKKEADRLGILFVTSVFDEPMVDFLAKLGIAALKVSSGDIVHKPLIKKAAATGIPLILSTGMASLAEMKKAEQWLKQAKARSYSFLHCVAVYPPRYGDLNLRFIPTLKKEFECPIGFSDHSLVPETSVAAVALGAQIIEKHFTLDKNLPGPDQKLSLDPNEFSHLIKAIRNVESSLGKEKKMIGEDERKCLETSRRGLKAKFALRKGEELSSENTILIKPSTGVPPAQASQAYGKKVKKNISAGTAIAWKDIQ